MASSIKFALNQATAPNLSFVGFLDLAASLGCVGVEPRNDMKRPLFDGATPEDAARMAEDRGLQFFGLSQVYPFNDWSAEREREIANLIGIAEACGAPGISLIPRVDGKGTSDGERQAVLHDVLETILPMLKSSGIIGMVEPIGFPSSSLRFKREVADIITALDAADHIQIVHDTFQHTLAGDQDFFPQLTGIVHISGISDPKPEMTEALDAERVLVDKDDRLGNIFQMQTLLNGGYGGVFSFECTARSLYFSKHLKSEIERSITYLNGSLTKT